MTLSSFSHRDNMASAVASGLDTVTPLHRGKGCAQTVKQRVEGFQLALEKAEEALESATKTKAEAASVKNEGRVAVAEAKAEVAEVKKEYRIAVAEARADAKLAIEQEERAAERAEREVDKAAERSGKGLRSSYGDDKGRQNS